MNLNEQAYFEWLDGAIDAERRHNLRPALMHGRRTEANVDPNQLPMLEVIDMRDPATGEMFALADYSQADGPDVVAP